MSSELRAGIAGAGFIGGVHARSVRIAGGTVVGVADANLELAQAGADRFGAKKAFASAEEMIASPDIDVIHVCTPNHLHLPIARAALEAGKPVICEKPLAIDPEGAVELVDLAKSTGLQNGVPFVYRYHPLVREARHRVATGATGDLRLLHGSYLQDWLLQAGDNNWRVSKATGGASRAFADIGSHWCDLIEFVSGHRLTRLVAKMQTAITERASAAGRQAFEQPADGGEVEKVDTEDAAIMQFETDKGAVGSVVISQISAGRKNRLWFELDGSNETLVFDQENPEQLWIGSRPESNQVQLRDPSQLSPDAARLTVFPGGHPQGYGDAFGNFVTDFYASVASGEAVEGMPVFADGMRANKITDAVLRSNAEGGWVDVAA